MQRMMKGSNNTGLRGDQIKLFKILNDYENIDPNLFLQNEGMEKTLCYCIIKYIHLTTHHN